MIGGGLNDITTSVDCLGNRPTSAIDEMDNQFAVYFGMAEPLRGSCTDGVEAGFLLGGHMDPPWISSGVKRVH